MLNFTAIQSHFSPLPNSLTGDASPLPNRPIGAAPPGKPFSADTVASKGKTASKAKEASFDRSFSLRKKISPADDSSLDKTAPLTEADFPDGTSSSKDQRSPEAFLAQKKQELKDYILSSLGEHAQLTDPLLCEALDRRLLTMQELNLPDRLYLRQAVFNSFRRLDLLSELLDAPDITEIMINSEKEIFLERNGRMEHWDKCFESREQLEELVQRIVTGVNRTVNTSRPIVDARLEDGSRVHVVLPPIALHGPTMTIRKFPEPITMERLIALDSITEEAAGFLSRLVRCGYNIFISGGTNSGKTTFLNALSSFIPSGERVITIEDSAELQLRGIPNLVSLETRNANTEGEGAITMSELIKASLRMSPNRIVVGEVRGGEALDMLTAMNTGHSGSLSTGHGNSPADMCRRLETMVLQAAELPLPAIRGMIASAIELLVHLGRTKDHKRRVLEITEVLGLEHGEIQFRTLFQYREGRLVQVAELSRTGKLLA